MDKYLIDGATLTSIADAIRAKKRTTRAIKTSEMANEISNLTSEQPLTLGEDKIVRFVQPANTYVNECNYTLWKLNKDSVVTNLSEYYGFAYGNDCNFSSYMSEPGSYFVTCLTLGHDYCVNGYYTSNVLSVIDWLFQNEQIDTNGRQVLDSNGEPIVPVAGTSYTLFVDGEELMTSTAFEDLGITELEFYDFANYRFWLKYTDNFGWSFDPDCTITGGNVSVRING